MASPYLTALEHQPIPIAEESSAWSLTPAEATRLSQIGELRPGFCEIGYRKVKLAQYCGVVSVGDRVLEILPKTQYGDAGAEECRGVLLRLLRASHRFPQFQYLPAGQHLHNAPLLEVFIAAYFNAIVIIGRGGLLRQYEQRDEDLSVVRGRIDIARQLTVHANRPDRVACSFDELTADNVWNRVLKQAMRVVRPWIRSVDLGRRWIELMNLFDEVGDSSLKRPQLMRLTFNRHAERYRIAIDWAKWILATLSPAFRAGSNEAPTLLFDMNKLFESAVSAVLKVRAACEEGLTVVSQDRGMSLAIAASILRSEPAFWLRPDLVVYAGNTPISIADAKWKAIEMDRAGRLVPSHHDLYQLHAYAAAFKCKDLALIYPWHSRLGRSIETRYELPGSEGVVTTVHILCVDVNDDALNLTRGSKGGRVGNLFLGRAAIES
ncbi:MAG: hypothetical protein ABIR26_03530 [Ramlibacter sp.]